MRKRTSTVWKIDKGEFRTICEQSESVADILRYFGLVKSSSSYRTVKQRAKEEGIDISHINLGLSNRKGKRQEENYKYAHEDVFCKNTKGSPSNANLVLRLVKSGIWDKPLACASCDLSGTWKGKPITLQLDHVNGESCDNRIENLRMLCPNCHSQTSTWAGRNIKAKKSKDAVFCVRCTKSVSRKTGIYCNDCLESRQEEVARSQERIEWPSVRRLVQSVKEHGWTGTARALSVSDNAVRNHLKRMKIDITRWKEW